VKPQLKELSLDVIDDPAAPARSASGFGDLEDLKDSIAQVGVIEPLVVARRNGRYEVVAGHRRLIASKMAGLVTVPCVIHDDFKAAEEAVMLHENIHRADLNPVDEARFFTRLLDRVDGDTERLAELVRERRDYVEQRLALLSGDPDVCQALERGELSLGVAAELNLYEHQPTRYAHLQLAVQGGSSVSLVRAWRKEANRFHQLQQTREEPVTPAAPTPDPAPMESPFVCYFCGSREHVEAMEQMYIHKPCKGLLRNALGDRFKE
jgi:ParB family transcriptional regulator, chromosome partitioning protein